jgi:hypothetical protein
MSMHTDEMTSSISGMRSSFSISSSQRGPFHSIVTSYGSQFSMTSLQLLLSLLETKEMIGVLGIKVLVMHLAYAFSFSFELGIDDC